MIEESVSPIKNLYENKKGLGKIKILTKGRLYKTLDGGGLGSYWTNKYLIVNDSSDIKYHDKNLFLSQSDMRQNKLTDILK